MVQLPYCTCTETVGNTEPLLDMRVRRDFFDEVNHSVG